VTVEDSHGHGHDVIALGSRSLVLAETLTAHCAARLARYKCPREVRFLPALPRTARGKRDRAALVAQHGWRQP